MEKLWEKLWPYVRGPCTIKAVKISREMCVCKYKEDLHLTNHYPFIHVIDILK